MIRFDSVAQQTVILQALNLLKVKIDIADAQSMGALVDLAQAVRRAEIVAPAPGEPGQADGGAEGEGA